MSSFPALPPQLCPRHEAMPRISDPCSCPAEGRAVAQLIANMELQADALNTNHVLITLGGERRTTSTSEITDALHDEFNVPRAYMTIVRHYPEDFLVTFTHPHHRDIVIGRGSFRRSHIDLHPKPWIMEAHTEHEEMRHHILLSLVGIPLHAWNVETIAHVIGIDCELDYILPHTARKEDTRTLGIWA